MISVKNLPSINNIINKETYEIVTNNVGYFTHSYFKYPAKFIPQLPAWAIKNLTSKNDIVLDCFAGSGTTLIEASLRGRECLGVDFDEISILLSKVKTTKLETTDYFYIKEKLHEFDINKYTDRPLPNLSNLNHWFPKENITKLNALFYFINEQKTTDAIKNFQRVCYISTIRKSSYSDEQSPKPYVSTRFKKEPKDPVKLFIDSIDKNFAKINDEDFKLHYTAKFIGKDARDFDAPEYYNKVKLVCASPPYINAFDYVRILRLENVWLRNLDDNNIIKQKKKQIGTELLYASVYNEIPPKIGIPELDKKINDLFKLDRKRAHIVCKYFLDMESNINNIKKYLLKDGYYVLVVGDCTIKGIVFPIYKYIIDLAIRNGYSNTLLFSYLIRNPYLRIPRKKRGGLIKYDRVIVLKN